MANYPLIQDFVTDPDEGVISGDPNWIIAVVRFANPLTYDRKEFRSRDISLREAMSTRTPTLVITSDCVSVGIQRDKGNYQKTLQAQLLGTKNYMYEMCPGDWVFCWMYYGEEKTRSLIDRIYRGEPCNKFDDGLKFVGRLQSIRKTLQQDRGGVRRVRYALQATGFRELNSQIFYDEYLSALPQDKGALGIAYTRIGASLNNLIRNPGAQADGNTGVSPEAAITTFLEVMLGSGVSSNWSNPGSSPIKIAAGLPEPIPYAVPLEAGKLLGKKPRSGGDGSALAYTDMLECHYGAQRYTENDGVDPGSPEENPLRYKIFLPDGISSQTGQYKYTGYRLPGFFIPERPNLANKPIWSVLMQWINPVVHEMYTALKITNEGDVVPAIVLRQVPFSSPAMSADDVVNKKERSISATITPFHELPRWEFDPVLVSEYDIGRADSVRFNFMHIYGTPTIPSRQNTVTKQLARCHPIRDDLDIMRNGLRAYSALINCSPQECSGDMPTKWMEFGADYVMGEYLTYTGTINSIGLQVPIAEGDNIQFDGVVYQIETLVHQCSISGNGMKNFITSMNVTYGVRADAELTAEKIRREDFGPPVPASVSTNGTGLVTVDIKFDTVNLYPGLEPSSETRYEPGQNSDDKYDAEADNAMAPTGREEGAADQGGGMGDFPTNTDPQKALG